MKVMFTILDKKTLIKTIINIDIFCKNCDLFYVLCKDKTSYLILDKLIQHNYISNIKLKAYKGNFFSFIKETFGKNKKIKKIAYINNSFYFKNLDGDILNKYGYIKNERDDEYLWIMLSREKFKSFDYMKNEHELVLDSNICLNFEQLEIKNNGIIIPFSNITSVFSLEFLKKGYISYIKKIYSWYRTVLNIYPNFFFERGIASTSLDYRHTFFVPDFGEFPLFNVPQVPLRIDANWILYVSEQVREFDRIARFQSKALTQPILLENYLAGDLQECDDLLQISKKVLKAKNFDKAKKIYPILEKRYPKHPDVLKSIGELECAKGNTRSGLRYLEQASVRNKHDREIVLLKLKNNNANNYENILLSCYEYLDMYPDDEVIRRIQNSILEYKAKEIITHCTDVPKIFSHHHYKVSSVVSTYKSEEFIENCLKDLVGQSIAEQIEIIVIDACSPENEGQIVKKFQKEYNNIYYYRTHKRIGIYEAWNMATMLAKGNYITPFSTNDSLNKKSYEILSEYLDNSPDVDLVFGNTYLTSVPHQSFHSFAGNDGHAMVWDGYDFEYNLLYCTIGPHPMWRRSLHDRVGYFDQRYKRVSDQEFFMRVGRRFNIQHIPYFTGLYWQDDNSISADAESLKELYEMRRHFRAVYAKERLKESVQSSFFQEIENALQDEDVLRAKEMWKEYSSRLRQDR